MLQTNEMQSAAVFKSRLDAIICKQSIEHLSERVKYSLLQKLEKGECIHKPPFGYKLLLTHRRKACDVQVSENEAQIVRQLFEMHSTGDYSMAEARSLITEAGLRSKKNCKMSKSQIERTLYNHFYYGFMQSDGLLHKHVYEPLISFAP